jgi:hypothetical protein
MTNVSKHVTIFEGPDGSGKTTLARDYAEATGARYVHCGPYPGVKTWHLARIYAEAMMPAILGYQDVVLDRCWISELYYGCVHREGSSRFLEQDVRMLERLALRCGAAVVRCLPPWPTVEGNYLARKGGEMLTSTNALKSVYDLYDRSWYTGLRYINHDYTRCGPAIDFTKFSQYLNGIRTDAHPLVANSAGNLNGSVILVGDTFGSVKSTDPMYQWPFASFSRSGCSQWLTKQLSQIGLLETDLLWLNADMPITEVLDHRTAALDVVIALGEVANAALTSHGIAHTTIPHPQYWKRFSSAAEYPLALACRTHNV